MEQSKALAIFKRLADVTFAWNRDTENGQEGETSTVFNVRLDAVTVDVGDRAYQLFVRLDNDAQAAEECDVNDHLRYLLEVAAEHDAEVELENGGVAIR